MSPPPAMAASALLPFTTRGGLGEAGLNMYRAIAGSYMRSRWKIDERGAFRVPEDGPVILASNHIGWLDGPLMIGLSPRPAHALVKEEAFTGIKRWLLHCVGQIKIRRQGTDAGALRTAVKALRAGQCVMVWPEGTRGAGELQTLHPGVSYLALVSGAPVVPIAIFGTREHNESFDSKPKKGTAIEIMYGDPIRIQRQEWPRSQADVTHAARLIGEHMRAHLEKAKDSSRIGLPGAL